MDDKTEMAKYGGLLNNIAAGDIHARDVYDRMVKAQIAANLSAPLINTKIFTEEKNMDQIVSNLRVRKIRNGLMMDVTLPGKAQESIFVESLEKLGDALVQYIVENKLES